MVNAAGIGLAALGAVIVLVGLANVTGLVPLSVATPSGPPLLSIAITDAVSGYNNTIAMHVNSLPTNITVVSNILVHYGSTAVDYKPATANAWTGHGFLVKRSYTWPSAGTFTVYAVATATSTDTAGNGQATFSTQSTKVAVSVPSNGPSVGCTNLCPSVSSEFTTTTSGLTATFTDDSVVSNGTITAIAWAFGDGTNGASTPVTHTYPAPGSYVVSENVTVTNVTGALAYSQSSATITVSGSSSGCQGTGCVSSPLIPGLTWLNGLLLFGGLPLLIVPLATTRYDILAVAVAVGAVAGVAAGFFL
jgi:hypothetical protein